MNESAADIITMGRIGTVHGVQGWLKLNSFTNDKETIFSLTPWYIKEKNDWQPLDISAKRDTGNQLLIKIKDCDGREEAKRYINSYIGVKRDSLPELVDGEYYWVDLEGLSVNTTSGKNLGTIAYIMATGSNDAFVVQGDDRELILPYIDDVVLKIDLKAQEVLVDWDTE